MADGDGGVKITMPDGTTVDQPQWMASLPDAHKQNPNFAQFKEAPLVWDRFDKLLKAEGSMITIPGEGASEAERAAFYGKLGRPETPDKYSIAKPGDLPEGIPYTPEGEKAFREQMHKLGVSDAHAKATWDWYWGMSKQGFAMHQKAEADKAKAEEQATEAALNTLKGEWKGDDFKVNSELATRAFKKFAGDSIEANKLIAETKINGVALGDHPVFLKLFHAIAKAVGDDQMHPGGGGGQGGGSDEEKAKSRFPNTKW